MMEWVSGISTHKKVTLHSQKECRLSEIDGPRCRMKYRVMERDIIQIVHSHTYIVESEEYNISTTLC